MCWGKSLTVLTCSYLVKAFANRSQEWTQLIEGLLSILKTLGWTHNSKKQIIFKELGQLHTCLKKNKTKSISLVLHKDQFKMTLKPYYKSPNFETARQKGVGNILRSWHRQGLSEMNSNNLRHWQRGYGKLKSFCAHTCTQTNKKNTQEWRDGLRRLGKRLW